MSWNSIYVNTLSKPSGVFSHATQIDLGQGRLTLTSGMVARNSDGSVYAPGDVGAQTRRVLESLQAVLVEAGCTGLEDAVSLMVHVTDIDEFAEIHAVRREFFPTDHLPASTMVQVTKLVHEDFLIEISAVAYTPNSNEEDRTQWLHVHPRPNTT